MVSNSNKNMPSVIKVQIFLFIFKLIITILFLFYHFILHIKYLDFKHSYLEKKYFHLFKVEEGKISHSYWIKTEFKSVEKTIPNLNKKNLPNLMDFLGLTGVVNISLSAKTLMKILYNFKYLSMFLVWPIKKIAWNKPCLRRILNCHE